MVSPVQNTLYSEIGLQCQMCKTALMLGLGSKLKKTLPQSNQYVDKYSVMIIT
jgi:hypothetical protein